MSKALETARAALAHYADPANWQATFRMHGRGVSFMPIPPVARDDGAAARKALADLDGADPSEVSGEGGAGAE